MKRGFTLIELLIVIAIIATLAAVLFPVYSSAKRKAFSTTCVSNLKQVGSAVALYSTDFEEYLPNGSDGRTGFGSLPDSGPRYMTQLMPYIHSELIFKCPGDVGIQMSDLDFGADINASPSAFAKLGTSYFYALSGYFPQTLSFASISTPAHDALFWDGSGAWHTGNQLVSTSESYDSWSETHRNYRYNVLFFDTHAKNNSWDQLADARF